MGGTPSEKGIGRKGAARSIVGQLRVGMGAGRVDSSPESSRVGTPDVKSAIAAPVQVEQLRAQLEEAQAELKHAQAALSELATDRLAWEAERAELREALEQQHSTLRAFLEGVEERERQQHEAEEEQRAAREEQRRRALASALMRDSQGDEERRDMICFWQSKELPWRRRRCMLSEEAQKYSVETAAVEGTMREGEETDQRVRVAVVAAAAGITPPPRGDATTAAFVPAAHKHVVRLAETSGCAAGAGSDTLAKDALCDAGGAQSSWSQVSRTSPRAASMLPEAAISDASTAASTTTITLTCSASASSKVTLKSSSPSAIMVRSSSPSEITVSSQPGRKLVSRVDRDGSPRSAGVLARSEVEHVSDEAVVPVNVMAVAGGESKSRASLGLGTQCTASTATSTARRVDEGRPQGGNDRTSIGGAPEAFGMASVQHDVQAAVRSAGQTTEMVDGVASASKTAHVAALVTGSSPLVAVTAADAAVVVAEEAPPAVSIAAVGKGLLWASYSSDEESAGNGTIADGEFCGAAALTPPTARSRVAETFKMHALPLD